MNFVSNRQMRCTACGGGPYFAREFIRENAEGKTYTECQWVCSKCGCKFATGIKKED